MAKLSLSSFLSCLQLLVLLVLLLVTLLLDSCVEAAGKDYYKILDVQRNASEKEISRAFRKLALKYHPDKNKDDPEAEKNFIDISKAYEVLGNKESRERYDRYGDDSDTGTGGNPFPSGHHNFASFKDFNMDLDDMFKDFDRQFGFGGGDFKFGRFPKKNSFFKSSGASANRHHRMENMDMFGDLFDGFGSFGGLNEDDSSFSGPRCRTVQRQTGNSFVTETTCT